MTLRTNPKEYLVRLPALINIKQCLLSDSPSLETIKAELTREEFSSILNLMIIDLVKYFSVGNSMGKEQVIQTVDLIMDAPEYKHLKLEDIKLCFNYAKKGWYGQIYNRIDGGVIFDCLNKYLEQQKEIKKHATLKKHDETKLLDAGVKRTGWTNERLSGLMELARELKAKDIAEQKKVMQKVSFNADQQKFDNKLFRQFDKLWEKFAVDVNRGKFIRRYGKILAVNEFLKEKYSQLERINKQLTIVK